MRSIRSSAIGGRPLPTFGYTGSTTAQSAFHGTARSEIA
jgi:hypothetical protein